MKILSHKKHIKIDKKLGYFVAQHILFAASDKRKSKDNSYAGKKRKAWNKLIKPFPNKAKRKLAKHGKGS